METQEPDVHVRLTVLFPSERRLKRRQGLRNVGATTDLRVLVCPCRCVWIHVPLFASLPHMCTNLWQPGTVAFLFLSPDLLFFFF